MPVLRRSTRLASANALDPLAVHHSESVNGNAKKGTEVKTVSSKLPEKEPIEVGDEMPHVTLTDLNDDQVDLFAQANSHKYLVIFAYPKAATPGCTRQLKGFESNFPFFSSNNVLVYGLSADSPKAQNSFASKHGAKFPLLSDPHRILISELGASKSPKGIIRSHWIFVNGKLAAKKSPVSPEVSVESARQEIQHLLDEDSKEGGATKVEAKAKAEDPVSETAKTSPKE